METKLLKDLARGEFFKRKADANKVYTRTGNYASQSTARQVLEAVRDYQLTK